MIDREVHPKEHLPVGIPDSLKRGREQLGVAYVETDERVGYGRPEFVSRFRSRAERRRRQLEEYRSVPFYRFEVVREGNRWAVVAFQNVAVRKA